jgi:hypothetical protein
MVKLKYGYLITIFLKMKLRKLKRAVLKNAIIYNINLDGKYTIKFTKHNGIHQEPVLSRSLE